MSGGFITGLIPAPYRLLAAGLAVVVALGAAWAFVAHREAVAAAAGRAEVQGKWDADKLARSTLALDTIKGYRAEEQRLAAVIKSQEATYAALQTKHASALAGQRDLLRERGELRDAIAAYAAGGGGAAADTAAAASGRAGTIGELLGDALRVSAACAAGAESASDGVRALVGAWPATDKSTRTNPINPKEK